MTRLTIGRTTRNRLTVAAMGCLLALLISAMSATGVGAASLQQPTETGAICADGAMGQTQGGATAEQGQSGSVSTEACGSAGGGGSAMGAGSVCAITLPAGAAPGTSIVVTGDSATGSCGFEIVSAGDAGVPAEPANGAVDATSGGCSFSLSPVAIDPNTAPANVVIVPDAGASTAGQPGVDAPIAIEIAPDQSGAMSQSCGVVELTPANVTTSAAAVTPGQINLTCTVVDGGAAGSTGGQAQGGQPAAGQAQAGAVAGQSEMVLSCVGETPGMTAGAGTGATVVCAINGKVVTDPKACQP